LNRHNVGLEFIRHGMPEGGSRYRGNAIDDPLSELGWRQMWDAMGDDHDWDAIVSSPLRRCREFAEAFAERVGVSAHIEPDLREIGFGCWEGYTRQQLLATQPEAFAAFYQDPVRHAPAGAESVVAMTGRIERVVDRLLVKFSGQRVLVVAHAGVMRAVIARVTAAPAQSFFRLSIPNAMRFSLLPGIPGTIRF